MSGRLVGGCRRAAKLTPVLGVIALVCGCESEKRRAWEPPPGAEVAAAASGPAWPHIAPPLPSASAETESGSKAGPSPQSSASPNALSDAEDEDRADGPPLGGLWVRCYGGFKPGSTAERDVRRLSLLCGPPTGMRPAPDAELKGDLSAGAPPLTASFRAPAGSCFRVFAVGDRGIEDLDVEIKSSRGKRVAADLTEDRWPIVYPDRPACTLETDTFTIEVRVRKGAGAAAAEVWLLPPA